MIIHILKPFSLEKKLGKAYNDSIKHLPDEDWVCLMDLDTMFLNPESPRIMYDYIEAYPDTGMFTCFTNRIHPLSIVQLLGGVVSENYSISHHYHVAKNQQSKFPKTIEINQVVSGFLMLFSKKTWNEIKFDETLMCLGVDNDFCRRILSSGKSIKRMDALYVWHTYRLTNGIKDKSHLM